MSARVVDMTGKRYGSLTAVRLVGPGYPARDMRWLVVCDCGSEFVAAGAEVRSGGITACKACALIRKRKAVSTHRETDSDEYVAWTAMKCRCDNAASLAFKNYGGRGIRVCSEWSESFERFLEDMGRKPSKEHTLDRINTDGDYTKANCRWATRLQQANNKRNNHRITIGGDTKTLAEWSRIAGLSESSIRRRAKKGHTGPALIKRQGAR